MPDEAEPTSERTRAIFDQLRGETHEQEPAAPPPEPPVGDPDPGAATERSEPSDTTRTGWNGPQEPRPQGGGSSNTVLGLPVDQLATLTAGLGSETGGGGAPPSPPAAVTSLPSVPPDTGDSAGSADEGSPSTPTTRPPRPLPRILAVANQKGGVGKTTTAVNLGASLADLGYRVLVVDLDPQGNASTGLGINIRDLHGSMYEVMLHDLPIEDCVEPTSVRNLFVAPSSLDLAGAEIELVPAFSRELRLRRALDEVRDDYDYVLIDCPPSLGLLTVNGLAAAGEVVVPIQCEYYALEGLGQLLRNVALVQKNLNAALEVSTIVLVMYDARTKLAGQVVSEVRAHFGDKVARNVIPRTVRLSEAPSFGQPILAFDGSSRGAIAYRELAKEVSGGPPQRVG